jgi:hypothetical protein
MNKHRSPATASEQLDHRDAALAAESIQRDFHHLISLFDRQLAHRSQDDLPAQPNISEAKLAAEHGLDLVTDLIELLRRSH